MHMYLYKLKCIFYICIFIIYILILGIEHKTSCVLGKHSTTELYPRPSHVTIGGENG